MEDSKIKNSDWTAAAKYLAGGKKLKIIPQISYYFIASYRQQKLCEKKKTVKNTIKKRMRRKNTAHSTLSAENIAK